MSQLTSKANTAFPTNTEQFKPNTTVAAVIHCQNGEESKFLLVEEVEHGKVVFNQPAGHVEAGENLINACIREVYEETGLTLEPDYVSGIYYYHRPDLALYYLRFCFVIELTEQLATSPQDSDITACHWLDLTEIKAKQGQLRSPMVLECIEDYLTKKLTGETIPLSMLKSNL